MNRRVVVTGLGAITPIGNNVPEFWSAVKQQKVGIGEITHFDATDYKCHLAAEVKDFDAKEYMDFRSAKRMEAFCQFAVAAAGEALEDSGLSMEAEDAYRVGTSISSGVGSLQAIEREHSKLLEKGPGRVNPLFVPMMISNMAAGNVSIQFGLKGKSLNISTACASGTNAIGEAFRTIQYGDAEVMVAGGTESCITPLGIAGFTSLTGRRCRNRNSGRIRTCQKTWGKDLCRSNRIWMFFGCIPYYISGRGWCRRSNRNDKCNEGCRCKSGRNYLYQCPWNQHPS